MPLANLISEPRTPAWLLGQLTGARIYDDAQIRPYFAEFSSAHPHGDAMVLAKYLTCAGVLTDYQAEQALAGEISKIVLGPYLLASPIGSGSLGTVYQALGRRDRKRYAVKVLPLRSLWNTHQAKKQVQIFQSLPAHPAIIPLVDIDTAGGSHYLVWTFAEGETLSHRIEQSGPLSIEETLVLLKQVVEGLQICHSNDIAHGLLKPSNLILGSDGQTRILDFGMGAILSENIADDESMLDTISTSNAAMGMIDCCAPETLNNPTLRSPSGDLYSLGCVLYTALTGQLPFPDGNVVDKVIAHQTQPPRNVRHLNPEVPEWLSNLINALLAKSPAERPESIAVVQTAIQVGTSAKSSSEAFRHVATMLPRVVPPASGVTSTPWLSTPARRQKHSLPSIRRTRGDDPEEVSFDVPVNERTDPGLSMPDADSNASHMSFDSVRSPLHNNTIPVLELALPSTRIGMSQIEKTANRIRQQSLVETPIPRFTPASLPNPAEFEPESASGQLKQAPELPAFARSWWYRLKQLLGFRRHCDLVQISLFGPPLVTPGETIQLQVYVHTPETSDSVLTLSRAFYSTGELLSTGYLDCPVAAGSTVGLHLAVTNAGVARALVMVNWIGQPQPRMFEVHVPWECPSGSSRAILSAAVDGTLAGKIVFDLGVETRRV